MFGDPETMPSVPHPNPREQLARIAVLADPAIDLVEGALWIAADAQPGLEIGPYLDWFDRTARQVAAHLDSEAGEREQIERLLGFLYGQQGFAGNASDYYDPRNSYLNQVIDRRTGIPITLAVVCLGLAGRLGLPLRGVSFPGHFLLRHAEHDALVIDPFGGRFLGERELAAKLAKAAGPGVVAAPELLAPAPNKEVLARMTRNLKQIHLQRRDLERALALCDLALLFASRSALDWRERGLVNWKLECFPEALRDLEQCLALGPPTGEREALERLIRDLRQRARRIN
jgi:regulator of sirC expression with transglutaminase-like and TPR domain